MMVLCGAPSLRDVLAFPKSFAGKEIMVSPCTAAAAVTHTRAVELPRTGVRRGAAALPYPDHTRMMMHCHAPHPINTLHRRQTRRPAALFACARVSRDGCMCAAHRGWEGLILFAYARLTGAGRARLLVHPAPVTAAWPCARAAPDASAVRDAAGPGDARRSWSRSEATCHVG